ncbi:Glutaredoxin [Natrarchaeobaculum sulfurireducens]|uniref:Glutaredoxin n=2 Tax=Natrarchaeobaculum sulfurireducens TaxID=2044521 RepID=A0A346PAV3_9EURY|nr:Glutaredoxin [Natrarchaeobaculum sulfurireducens]
MVFAVLATAGADATFIYRVPIQWAMNASTGRGDGRGGDDRTDPPITFYRLQACPYCERVTRTLQELDLEYRSRFVEPLHSKRDVVKRVAGVRTVPVIVDEDTGVTMAESANIVDYLESTYGDGTETSVGEQPAAADRDASGGDT